MLFLLYSSDNTTLSNNGGQLSSKQIAFITVSVVVGCITALFALYVLRYMYEGGVKDKAPPPKELKNTNLKRKALPIITPPPPPPHGIQLFKKDIILCTVTSSKYHPIVELVLCPYSIMLRETCYVHLTTV